MLKVQRVPNEPVIFKVIKEVHYVDEVTDSVYNWWYSRIWHNLLRPLACVNWCKQIKYAEVSNSGLLMRTIDFNIKYINFSLQKPYFTELL
jgi:hypothetical protein